jgi:nucleotide-binding universal stress UspA family protein
MGGIMKIMVCYDGSNAANNALDLAIKHAGVFGAKIFLINSIEGGPQIPRESFDQAEKNLKSAKTLVRKADLACESYLSERGVEPGEDLVQYATENQIDTIFIGARNRSTVGKFIFGSTVQYVILNAACPVVTVK